MKKLLVLGCTVLVALCTTTQWSRIFNRLPKQPVRRNREPKPRGRLWSRRRVAESLGLGSCMLGGYFDDEVDRMIGIDGVMESVQNAMAVGFPIR